MVPPSAVKFTVVPSGTGLLKLSASQTEIIDSVPIVLASGFSTLAAIVNEDCSGRPVLTDSSLD